jgi:hypothetical protein
MTSVLDANQVLSHAFDDSTQRLRVDSTATIVGGSLDVVISDIDDSIKIGDGSGIYLDINADGSINERLHDGSGNPITSQLNGTQRALDVGINVAGVQIDPRDIRALTAADVVTANQGGVWNINDVTGTIALPTGASTLAEQVAQTALLTNIDSTLVTGINSLTIGTEDGTTTGTQRVFVNNLRSQILATQDRDQDITYADFGTKNQRVTRIDYTSAIFPATTARKDFTYTLVGTKYRLDSIVWSIV